jgi:hypothetical protein
LISFFIIKNLIIYLEIIPIDKDLTKAWYEFEGAATYEYAHAEVKASKDTATT